VSEPILLILLGMAMIIISAIFNRVLKSQNKPKVDLKTNSVDETVTPFFRKNEETF
jgi:hypothetical protein